MRVIIKTKIYLLALLFSFFAFYAPVTASAAPSGPNPNSTPNCNYVNTAGKVVKNNCSSKNVCGGVGFPQINTSINIGCHQEGNPIIDLIFAIIRLLSDGVGLVIVGSLVVAGIQYSSSRGDPQATAAAVNRIRSTIFALLLFIFGYAILNYIIPAEVLH